jgi:CRP/FNR family cyclic AMP-dependent transcriptional regulator
VTPPSEPHVDLLQFFEGIEHEEAVTAGTTVFAAGDEGRAMYVVREGTVGIEVDGTEVASLGRGEVFGEMALIEQAPRSATAVARTDCRLIAIDEPKFLFMVHQTPYFSLDLLRLLAARLRAINRLL